MEAPSRASAKWIHQLGQHTGAQLCSLEVGPVLLVGDPFYVAGWLYGEPTLPMPSESKGIHSRGGETYFQYS